MNKISADQLAKRACVYIRQSTPGQVQNNLESQRLQHAIVDRARQLGWAEKGPNAMVHLIARVIGIGVETADMLVSDVLSRQFPRP